MKISANRIENSFKDFICKCLTIDFEKRPKAVDLLREPLFEGCANVNAILMDGMEDLTPKTG